MEGLENMDVKVASTLEKLKKQVQADRQVHVKVGLHMRVESNREQLKRYTEELVKLNNRAKECSKGQEPEGLESLCLHNERVLGLSNTDESGDKDGKSGPDESNVEKLVPIIFGSCLAGKTAVRPVKLPKVENVPPYTTWIYLDRNQRMTEDQSVVGRRRIYYDSDGNETLIASDSEEEDAGDDDDKEHVKHDFTKGEDSIIWMMIQELGLSPILLAKLADLIDIKPEDVEARYEVLLREADKKVDSRVQEMKVPDTSNVVKSLSPGRRKTSTKDLARAAAKEAREAAKESVREAAKEAPFKELTVEADVDNHHKSQVGVVLPAALEDDQTQPKDLVAAMDSFDNLFCRRCLVFDCRLHGCSQAIVHPSERQQPWSNREDGDPVVCSEHCCHLSQSSDSGRNSAPTDAPVGLKDSKRKQGLSKSSEEQQDLSSSQKEDGDVLDCEHKRSRTSAGEIIPSSDRQGAVEPMSTETVDSLQNTTRTVTTFKQVDLSKKLEKLLGATRKTGLHQPRKTVTQGEGSELLKSQQSQEDSMTSLGTGIQESAKDEPAISKTPQQEEVTNHLERGEAPACVGSGALSGKWLRLDKHTDDSDKVEGGSVLEAEGTEPIFLNVPALMSMHREEKTLKNSDAMGKAKVEVGKNWTMLEMGLYKKGVQIFGKNSCLIAKNLLKGFKTCAEVAQYTLEQETMEGGPDGGRHCTDSLDIDAENRARKYGGRRKGRVRKLKYTWKSVVHPLIRKRMANGKDQPCRQYTPCSCLFTCGRQCPCLLNGTCCEKYCGCSKSCKNRFRGCHCAKSQCCSRQCPCFAAGRECDPDVCRNCWVGCGDGTLGGPPARGDSYDCHNMKLMLKQQQQVLLGRSDVAGWGAFLKNPVGKHEYLGEYTGELISHREADKRGKIYDRENSSFLFNLNDQYVLDACRKGDKLKFANHSPNPNCHAKVIMVSGDHRVGIFAKERIGAGEEIFYDYRYEADRAPVWAKKQDDPNQKVQDMLSTSGRARKLPEGKPL
ncbi:hypothetical protein CY35_11G005800 [Sphagnum magellanicum]|nr:hypothetical protein CY35_11G005800 [Sphagnum magellanicum]